jgi:DCN1-like protein 1/2
MKGVPKDLWMQLGEFVTKTMDDESLSWWDENDSWPSQIDQFVAFVREKRRSPGGGEDGEKMEE